MILKSPVALLVVVPVFLAHIVEPPYRARTFLRDSSDNQRWLSLLTRDRACLVADAKMPSWVFLEEGIVTK